MRTVGEHFAKENGGMLRVARATGDLLYYNVLHYSYRDDDGKLHYGGTIIWMKRRRVLSTAMSLDRTRVIRQVEGCWGRRANCRTRMCYTTVMRMGSLIMAAQLSG